MADKKSAPLPASSGGLMRFFEDETKGFRIDPRIIVCIPISLIVVSWAIELFLTPLSKYGKSRRRCFKYPQQVLAYLS